MSFYLFFPRYLDPLGFFFTDSPSRHVTQLASSYGEILVPVRCLSLSLSEQGRNVALLVHEFPDAGGSSGGGGGGGSGVGGSKVTITLNGTATIQVRTGPPDERRAGRWEDSVCVWGGASGGGGTAARAVVWYPVSKRHNVCRETAVKERYTESRSLVSVTHVFS